LDFYCILEFCCLILRLYVIDPKKILGQFVTRMRKFIGQSDVKHIMTSPIKIKTSVQTHKVSE
jgi:hypothetical protein